MIKIFLYSLLLSFLPLSAAAGDKLVCYQESASGIIADISTGQNIQPRFYNGKELDRTNNLWWYDFVARPYDPTRGQFTNPDLLAEKFCHWNPWIYCKNNPINMIDPDGMGDYYTADGRWLGSDGCKDDKVYKAQSVTLSKKGIVEKATNIIDLNISYNEFINQSSTIYGESSAYLYNSHKNPSEELKNEMFSIASVLQRNNKAYGINSQQAKKFRNQTDESRNNLPLMRTAIAAEINAITGGFDYSYGAVAWDGAEQSLYPESDNRRSTGKFELHMNTGGWNINPEHYEKWKKNVGGQFKAPMIKIAPKYLLDKNYNRIDRPNLNAGKMRYNSTAVYGKTIFWKISK